MKGTFHKSCSCRSCRLGRGSDAGQEARRANEKKLRANTKQALKEVLKGADDADVHPISSPYTD